MNPGVYAGLPMDQYLELPAFSAGLTNTLLSRCARAAWFESWLNPNRVLDPVEVADAGSIAHSIVLEGTEDLCTVINPIDHPNQKGGGFATGWTNSSIKAARDAAREAGKIPVLTEDMTTIRGMARAARAFIDSLKHSEPAVWRAFEPEAGESELTCLWDDGGTLCRMRPDRVSRDRLVMCDLKFTKTSANPEAFGRSMLLRMGYHISAGFYRRGAEAIFGHAPDYLFIVVEQDPPHLCSLIGLDPSWLAVADACVKRGLRTWKSCVATGRWPSYPAKAAYPELPPWEMARNEEDEIEALFGDDPKLDFASQA